MLARVGYILHTWGDADSKYQGASFGKTFTRMALQLAIDKGLIASENDLVKDYWTGAGQPASHKVMTEDHNASVKFVDLRDMKSGFRISNGWFWRTQNSKGMMGPTKIPSWAKYTGDPDPCTWWSWLDCDER